MRQDNTVFILQGNIGQLDIKAQNTQHCHNQMLKKGLRIKIRVGIELSPAVLVSHTMFKS